MFKRGKVHFVECAVATCLWCAGEWQRRNAQGRKQQASVLLWGRTQGCLQVGLRVKRANTDFLS